MSSVNVSNIKVKSVTKHKYNFYKCWKFKSNKALLYLLKLLNISFLTVSDYFVTFVENKNR